MTLTVTPRARQHGKLSTEARLLGSWPHVWVAHGYLGKELAQMRPKLHGVCTRAGKNGAHVGSQEDAEWLAREAKANGWV